MNQKTKIGLAGITTMTALGLSGCVNQNYNGVAELENYAGVTLSDSFCDTGIIGNNIYSRLEFTLEDDDEITAVTYIRNDWANCYEFPKIAVGDKINIVNGTQNGASITVTHPQGIIVNQSRNDRYVW